mgnify:CR=1 FL=1
MKCSVASEGDLELYVRYITNLVKPRKNQARRNRNPLPIHIEIVFSSEDMMHIFMDNLFKNFFQHNVPRNNLLNIKLSIPTRSQDDPEPPSEEIF